MIPKPILRALITKRMEDAKALLKNRRYAATIYMAGYVLEIALKYRICKIMQFGMGFPENSNEFDSYYSNTRKTRLRSTIRQLKDIKNHDLTRLLRYSGKQVNIETHLLIEWNFVKNWNPEMRYSNDTIRRQRATDFLHYTKQIINELL
jgi:HEPN domain-containing protein